MDWWRLFSGTFVLIFLAELGDKTQLAAMAKTADAPDSSMAKWIVFAGASLALVVSTFIAVFLGHVLKAVVPDERYIKIAAALLFLIFGFSILFDTFASFRGKQERAPLPAEQTGAAIEPGLAGGLALRAAMDFEELSMRRYRRIAEKATPVLGALLLELADEEESHLQRLRGIPAEQLREVISEHKELMRTRASERIESCERCDAEVVEGLIDHEEASAAFYRDVAERTLIPSVRSALAMLAAEEEGHAARLRAIANA